MKQQSTSARADEQVEEREVPSVEVGVGENSTASTPTTSASSGSSASLDEDTKLFEGVPYPSYVVDILNSGEYLLQNQYKKFPDPTFDVCDAQVKIGDLGNACWVVSLIVYSCCIFSKR